MNRIFSIFQILMILLLFNFSKTVNANSILFFTDIKVSTSESDSSENEDKNNSMSVGVDWTNSKTFKGKKTPGGSSQSFASNASFTHKSGFGASLSVDYLPAESTPFDQITTSVCYDYELGEKSDIGTSYSHYFSLNSSSTQIQSVAQNNADAYISRKFGDFKTKLLVNCDIGTVLDYGFTWSNRYSFDKEDLFKKDDELSLTPTIAVTFGTQNIYKAYLENKTELIKKKKPGTTIKDPKNFDASFSFVNANLSLSISYSIKKFTFEISGDFYITDESQTKKPKYTPSSSFGAGISYNLF